VVSLEDLRRAAEAGRIRELPGFGEKTEQKILHELLTRHGEEQRILRPAAAQYGEALLQYLRTREGVQRAEIAGSFRRGRETVGDLDVLVSARRGAEVVRAFVEYPEVREVLARGSTKASVRLRSGLQVDLRVLADRSFGAALHYFTGSKPHNIAVRRLGQQKGLKINEYGIFRGSRRIGGRTEEEVFEAVGLPWIPPELREDRGELEAAAAGELPRLVDLEDLRGDLQVHTTDSDGRDTLEEMAEAAAALGHEYLAITDHSPAVRIAQGMRAADFRRQMKRIETLNRRLRGITLLRGAEVDICRMAHSTSPMRSWRSWTSSWFRCTRASTSLLGSRRGGW
jgi:DNA polymerase (family 10)